MYICPFVFKQRYVKMTSLLPSSYSESNKNFTIAILITVKTCGVQQKHYYSLHFVPFF
jgi:hypothetical protein